jgi:hypothetical protein
MQDLLLNFSNPLIRNYKLISTLMKFLLKTSPIDKLRMSQAMKDLVIALNVKAILVQERESMFKKL